MSEKAPAVLFSEPGARYRTIAYGPVLCGIILILEIVRGGPLHWFGLVFCSLLLAGFVWLQVIAGRRHISVELTTETLREGTESLAVSDIAAVLPEIDEDSWDDEDWESARALGELTGVPRRRKGIGLKLKSGQLVQAWARDHRVLRAELTALVEETSGTTAVQDQVVPPGAADESAADAAVAKATADETAADPAVALDKTAAGRDEEKEAG
ncbi:hypothetical protein ABZ319_34745 [Nocardia sp. NPDC005978]|uniref:hypothetical protein n=1 Tax=Nocardia sp. NPDC005978 TaxID=3156725 RepID=UPI0033AB0C86